MLAAVLRSNLLLSRGVALGLIIEREVGRGPEEGQIDSSHRADGAREQVGHGCLFAVGHGCKHDAHKTLVVDLFDDITRSQRRIALGGSAAEAAPPGRTDLTRGSPLTTDTTIPSPPFPSPAPHNAS